jgi:hypothetical protein
MKYFSILMTLFLFSNCDSTRQTQYNNPNASFDTILESAYGGKDEKKYTIIRSNSELKSEMAHLNLEASIMNRISAVDFKNQLVLALHMGTKNTGGYSIGVSNVEINGNTTYVTVRETGPQPGENVTMALTQPFAIVVIDANETIIFNKK